MRTLLVAALGCLLFAGGVRAADGDCTNTNETHGNTTGERLYRVNVGSFDNIATVTQTQGRQAAILAADTWNEQANAGVFTYDGSSTRTSLPENKADCDTLGIDYSLITVVDGGCGGNACRARCEDGGVGTQFEVTICENLDWFVGSVPSSGDYYDLVKVITHEIGHSFNINHPSDDEEATMSSNSVRENNGRDLYHWDIKCTQEEAGDRDLTAFRSYQDSSGNMGTGTAFSGSYDVAQLSAGVYYSSGGTYQGRSATLKDNDYWVWLKGLSVYPFYQISYIAYPDDEDMVSIGPREVVWREDPDRQRILYSGYKDHPTDWSYYGKHRLRYTRLQSDTGGSQGYGYVSECDSMTGWMTCSSTSQIYTGKPVAVTWDEYNDISVTAWAVQDRLSSNTTSREVRVAFSYIYNNRLPESDGFSVRTRVGPAVACKNSSGYNCILLYVDQESADGKIRIKRFEADSDTNRYSLTAEASYTQISVYTGSSLAAWYNSSTSKFYFAIRSGSYSQPLYVYSSSNGTSWTYEDNIDDTLIGPTAASYHDGSTNVVVYAK